MRLRDILWEWQICCSGFSRRDFTRKGFMNRDTIKYIAVFTMLLNHIANIFLEQGTLLWEIFVDIGYFTAITMCYFLVEGYGYTRSKEKYGNRLLIFAAISQIPFCLAFTKEGVISFVNMNMIFTLFLCFLILQAMEKMLPGMRKNLCITGLVLASLYSDWGFLAPVFTIWFAEARLEIAGTAVNRGKKRSGKVVPGGKSGASRQKETVPGEFLNPENRKDRGLALWKVFGKAMALFGIFNFIENSETMSVGKNLLHSVCSVTGILVSGLCIIYFYNGKRAQRHRNFSKWFFYIFYPAHLLVLGVLRLV